jgi:hypothetical protein
MNLEQFKQTAISKMPRYALEQKTFMVNQFGPSKGEEFFECYKQNMDYLRRGERPELLKAIEESYNKVSKKI